MKKFFAGLLAVSILALMGCGSSGSDSVKSVDGSYIAATSTKFTDAMVVGKTYSFSLVINVNGADMGINPETIKFNSDGTGTSTGAFNSPVTWSIDSVGRLIVVHTTPVVTLSTAITDASNPSIIRTNFYEFSADKTINTLGTATMTLK